MKRTSAGPLLKVMLPGKTFATSHQYDQHNPGSALAWTEDESGGGGTAGGGGGGEGATATTGRGGSWKSTVALDKTGETGFFQAFMAASPGHELLRRYLERMSAHYSGDATKLPMGTRNLGVYALGQVFAEWVSEVGETNVRRQTQLFSELRLTDFDHVPEVKSLRRQNGAGCCCNFVVYDEYSGRTPFYSRIVGVCDGGNNGCCDLIPGQDDKQWI